MKSLCGEVLTEILLCTDRCNLEKLQLTSRKLAFYVDTFNGRLPLRHIRYVRKDYGRFIFGCVKNGERWIRKFPRKTTRNALLYLFERLRNSVVVGELIFDRYAVTPQLVTYLQKTAGTIVIRGPLYLNVNFKPNTAPELLLETLSLSAVQWTDLPVIQLTDDVLEAAMEKDIDALSLGLQSPIKYGNMPGVSEDAVLEFCFGAGIDNAQSNGRFLRLPMKELSTDFFDRLLEGCRHGPYKGQLVFEVYYSERDVVQKSAQYENQKLWTPNGFYYDFEDNDVHFQIALARRSLKLRRIGNKEKFNKSELDWITDGISFKENCA
jgi:hypothetical protein